MPSQMIPFSFESNLIRVITLDDRPMFNARDVATALDYANPSKAYQDHCKSLKKLSYNEMLELNWPNPNPQGEYLIPEADVFRLVMRSKKPEAERFQDWVCEEVLPTIRRTGSYTPADPVLTSYRRATGILKEVLEISRLLGTDLPMARTLALDHVRQHTGLDFPPLLTHNAVSEPPMTPTALGLLINFSGRWMNNCLQAAGLQTKNEHGDWIPTDKGKPYSTCNPYKSPHSTHTGYRTLWYRSVLDILPANATAEN